MMPHVQILDAGLRPVRYIKKKPVQIRCALQVTYDEHGKPSATLVEDVPTDVPTIPLRYVEFDRLARHFRLIGRIPRSERERQRIRQRRLREASERYNAKIRRQLQGRREPGPIPESTVEEIRRLLANGDPETGKAMTGVEIALKVGVAPSFVSRVKNGQR